MHSNIVHVDSSAHAESVIKSLRSASLSQKRYQRNAELGDSIFTTLANFDTIVSTQLKETKKKQDIDAKINIVPSASRFPVKDASEDSDNDSPRFEKLSHTYNASAADSDSSEDEYAEQKGKRIPAANLVNSPQRQFTGRSAAIPIQTQAQSRQSIDFDQDDDDDDPDDTKDLFQGFIAPRVTNTGDIDDGPIYKKPTAQLGVSQPKTSAPSGMKTSEKSKFSSKLAASVSSSHQHQDFGMGGNSHVIVKPGQRIVVKARGRKSSSSYGSGASSIDSNY